MKSKTFGSRFADASIWAVLLILTALCFLPLLNMVSISFSDKSAAQANLVGLLPVNFNFNAYKLLLDDAQFWRSFVISLERVVIGTGLNLLLSVLMAYPLSKNKHSFHARNVYMNIMIFAMLFSGGMIPIFMVVKSLGLIDSVWSLILPGAVPIFNVILLMNFLKAFRTRLKKPLLWTVLPKSESCLVYLFPFRCLHWLPSAYSQWSVIGMTTSAGCCT